MKQFKVRAKNSVYSVFADSEVEAVNKVKEVESKINDSFSSSLDISISSIDEISISEIVKLIKDRLDRPVKKITNGKFFFKGTTTSFASTGLEFQVYAQDDWGDGSKFTWGSVTLYVKVPYSVLIKLHEEGGYILDKFYSDLKRKLKTYENKTIYEDRTLMVDSKVNDAYDIKPGAIFKSGKEERFNGTVINRYLKVMKLMKINGEDVALVNSIIKNGDQYETSYSDEWSFGRLKRYLSLGEYRPVNSLYDSKIHDDFYVYLESPYGKEMIGRYKTRAEAEQRKAEKEKEWKPGYLWHVTISTNSNEEYSLYWDSKKVSDSKKLSDLAYELAQMANYFDRANSSHSRKWLAKDDEVMLRKFFDLGVRTLNQLKIDIDRMEKAGIEPNTNWWGDNETYGLLKDASSRMYFTNEPKLVALSKKFDPLISIYNKLINGGNK